VIARALSGGALTAFAGRRAALGLLVLVQLVLLRELSEGRFLLLLRGGAPVEVLWYLHTATKVSFMAGAAFLVAAMLERRFSGPPLLPRGAFVPVLVAQAGLFLALLALIAALPQGFRAGLLAETGLWRYAAVSALFLSWQAGTLALLAPRAIVTGPSRRAALFVLCAVVAALLLSSEKNAATDLVRSMVEGSTLSLSLAFYDVIGTVEPVLTYRNGTPLLAAAGFAILISPVCAGYQGMLVSAVVMSGLIALEWPVLRWRRAILLGVAAVAGVFVLNALRIALLFHIGVTYSPDMAVDGFHSYFGTLSLLAVVALAMLMLQHPLFRRQGAPAAVGGASVARPIPQETDAAGLILPLAIYLGIGMVLGLFIAGFNWLYPLSVIAGLVLMALWRGAIAREFDDIPGLSGFVTGFAVFGLWLALVPVDPEADRAFAATLSSVPASLAAGWMLMRLVGFSVVVPVLEELAFRGGLFRLVAGWAAPVAGRQAAAAAAFVLTSLAFGAMHSDMLAGTLAGAGFALLVLRTGRVGDAIIAHAVTNFLLAVTAMATGHWSLW
jgi:exosortase E/protease (VPEID-CTERM system)